MREGFPPTLVERDGMPSIDEIDEDERRDRELAKKVGDEIETTVDSLHRALIGQNRSEEAAELSRALSYQADAYRDLREIDGS